MGAGGFLTCRNRVGEAQNSRCRNEIRSYVASLEGFWAWQKVADNSTNRPGARVCTLVVFRRGALASAGSSGRENIGSGSLYKERDWFAWVAWPRGLVCSGDRATQGPPQDWEVSLNFLRCRPCWIGNTR